jgi:hypothetical protein
LPLPLWCAMLKKRALLSCKKQQGMSGEHTTSERGWI